MAGKVHNQAQLSKDPRRHLPGLRRTRQPDSAHLLGRGQARQDALGRCQERDG
jgi:predicted NAD-dependent protein-ADP-ribosyltransferase YbiA (DUF1768 family)